MRVLETEASNETSAPAASVIATAGAARAEQGHLYADDVLSMLSFNTLADLLPVTSSAAICSIDKAVAPLAEALLAAGSLAAQRCRVARRPPPRRQPVLLALRTQRHLPLTPGYKNLRVATVTHSKRPRVLP